MLLDLSPSDTECRNLSVHLGPHYKYYKEDLPMESTQNATFHSTKECMILGKAHNKHCTTMFFARYKEVVSCEFDDQEIENRGMWSCLKTRSPCEISNTGIENVGKNFCDAAPPCHFTDEVQEIKNSVGKKWRQALVPRPLTVKVERELRSCIKMRNGDSREHESDTHPSTNVTTVALVCIWESMKVTPRRILRGERRGYKVEARPSTTVVCIWGSMKAWIESLDSDFMIDGTESKPTSGGDQGSTSQQGGQPQQQQKQQQYVSTKSSSQVSNSGSNGNGGQDGDDDDNGEKNWKRRPLDKDEAANPGRSVKKKKPSEEQDPQRLASGDATQRTNLLNIGAHGTQDPVCQEIDEVQLIGKLESSGEPDEEYLGIGTRLFSAREDAMRLPSIREELLPPSPGNSSMVQQLVMCVAAALCFGRQTSGSQCGLCSWLLRHFQHFLECLSSFCGSLSIAGIRCLQCRLAVSAIDMHVRRCCQWTPGDCVLCRSLGEMRVIQMNEQNHLALQDFNRIRRALRRVMVAPPPPNTDRLSQPQSLPVTLHTDQPAGDKSLPIVRDPTSVEDAHGGARPKTCRNSAPRVNEAGQSFTPHGPLLSRQNSSMRQLPSGNLDLRAFHDDPVISGASDQAIPNISQDSVNDAIAQSLRSVRFSEADNVLPPECIVFESGRVFYGQIEDVEEFLLKIEQLRDSVWAEDDTTEGIVYRQYHKDFVIEVCEYAENRQWMTIALLGGGAFGKCYVGRDKTSGFDFCVKKVPIGKMRSDECVVLSHLSNRHIMRCFGVLRQNGHVCFLFQLLTGCSLKEYVSPQDSLPYPLSADLALQLLLQLVSVLQHHQEHDVIHGDLKPDNIMLRQVEEGGDDIEVVVVDYGTVRSVTGPDFLIPGGMIGSPPEMSPEKARGEAHGFPAEVWALATIIIFMLNGVEPWVRSCDSKLQLLFQIGKNPNAIWKEISENLPPEMQDLLRRMLETNAGDRPTAEEIPSHPAFQLLNTLPPLHSVMLRHLPSNVRDDYRQERDGEEEAPKSVEQAQEVPVEDPAHLNPPQSLPVCAQLEAREDSVIPISLVEEREEEDSDDFEIGGKRASLDRSMPSFPIDIDQFETSARNVSLSCALPSIPTCVEEIAATSSSSDTATPSTPSHDTATPSTPSHDTATPSTPSHDTATPSTPSHDTATPSTPSHDTATPSTPSHDTATPSTPSHDTATPSTPSHEAMNSGDQSTDGGGVRTGHELSQSAPAQQFSQLDLADGRREAAKDSNGNPNGKGLGHSSSRSGFDLALRSHDETERGRGPDNPADMTPSYSPVDVDSLEKHRSLQMNSSSVDLDRSGFGNYFDDDVEEIPKGSLPEPTRVSLPENFEDDDSDDEDIYGPSPSVENSKAASTSAPHYDLPKQESPTVQTNNNRPERTISYEGPPRQVVHFVSESGEELLRLQVNPSSHFQDVIENIREAITVFTEWTCVDEDGKEIDLTLKLPNVASITITVVSRSAHSSWWVTGGRLNQSGGDFLAPSQYQVD